MYDYADGYGNESELEPDGACDPKSMCDEDYALSMHAQVLSILRVFMFVSIVLVVDVVCLMLVLSAHVVLFAVCIQFS